MKSAPIHGGEQVLLAQQPSQFAVKLFEGVFGHANPHEHAPFTDTGKLDPRDESGRVLVQQVHSKSGDERGINLVVVDELELLRHRRLLTPAALSPGTRTVCDTLTRSDCRVLSAGSISKIDPFHHQDGKPDQINNIKAGAYEVGPSHFESPQEMRMGARERSAAT